MQKRELTKDDRSAGMALGNMFYDLSGANSNAGGLAAVCAAFTQMVPLLNTFELLALAETNPEIFSKYMSSYGSDGNAYIQALRDKALDEILTVFKEYQDNDGESINN